MRTTKNTDRSVEEVTTWVRRFAIGNGFTEARALAAQRGVILKLEEEVENIFAPSATDDNGWKSWDLRFQLSIRLGITDLIFSKPFLGIFVIYVIFYEDRAFLIEIYPIRLHGEPTDESYDRELPTIKEAAKGLRRLAQYSDRTPSKRPIG